MNTKNWLLSLTGMTLLALTNSSSAAPADKSTLNLGLGGEFSGAQAVAALGEHLPDVANAHRMTADKLRKLLTEDQTLKVDRHGRLLYQEPDLITLGGPVAAESALPESAPPSDQAFLLHSRPGAKKRLYLDFDGHVLSGTAWNASYNAGQDIVCPPWDLDGNPGAFSDTEKARIVQMWQRVSEDYAPFDVDVTTEYPGEAALTRSNTSDDTYGMRVLISPISSYVGNYGGIAYIGAFDDIGDYYKPALVFPEKLSNGEKYIAEACSHEAGHNLGLNHDGKTDNTAYYSGHGSGETGWAPIMGVGYYQNLSQWSKGEYAMANNTQDDLTIIQGYLGLRPDDHGNTIATATALPTGSSLTAAGLIGTSSDADMFRFVTGSGLISINVLPYELGPNLDLALDLFDSSGALLASANPLNLLSANLNISLVAGTYFIRVRGTGAGDPLITGYTSYASLGQYTVAATVIDPSGTVPPVAKFTATPNSGDGPLTAQFNSAQSYDPDGAITGYFWSFGDGATSQEPNPTHVYAQVGDFSATLTVSDNQGLTGTDSLMIRVLAPNTPPTASVSTSATTGVAPFTVTFSGANSVDSDGSIVSYQWNFGDGGTGSGATIQHVYQNAGSYTARLTVTDNRGATGSTTVTIQATPNMAKVLRVQAIALSPVTVKRTTTVEGRVTVTDANGLPVSGVSVSGTWTGQATGTSTATTDNNGVALLKSKALRKSGNVTLTVSGLTKATFTYDSARNIVSSASISAVAAH